jgi:hypothetical protein
MDVSKIPVGYNFPSYLNMQLAKCDIFLAMLGPNWLAKDSDGIRRIDKPDDFVRIEIIKALEQNLTIVPVLVDGASLPKAVQLPDVLKPLILFNAAELRNSSFDRDSEALAKHFEGLLLRLRRWRWVLASVGSGFVVLTSILLGYLWLTKPQLSSPPPGVAMIDPASRMDVEIPFEMATLPGAPHSVNLSGSYSVSSGKVKGTLKNGTFRTTNSQIIFSSISALAFQACYLQVISGVDQINRFPISARGDNSESLSIVPEKGNLYGLTAFSFSFELPQRAQAGRTWLCAALIFNGEPTGGFIPVQ